MENLELVKLTPDKMNVRTSLPPRLRPLSSFGSCPHGVSLLTQGSEVEQRNPGQPVQAVPGQELLEALLCKPPAREEAQIRRLHQGSPGHQQHPRGHARTPEGRLAIVASRWLRLSAPELQYWALFFLYSDPVPTPLGTRGSSTC